MPSTTRSRLVTVRATLFATALALTAAAMHASQYASHLDAASATPMSVAGTGAANNTGGVGKVAAHGLPRSSTSGVTSRAMAPVVTPLPHPRSGCGLQPKPSTSAATTIGKPQGCRILVIGDSLGNNLASGMLRQLAGRTGISLIVRSKASTGLSNLWFYNWPDKLAPMVSRYRPHLVIVLLGANDHQNFKLAGRVVQFGSTEWKNEYLRRMRQITSIAASHGSYVAWIGLPVMAPTRYSQAMRQLNMLYATVDRRQGAVFLPTWDYFATSTGAFRQRARVNAEMTKVRGDDGIHFTSAGGEVLASFVLDRISSTFHVGFNSTHPARITG